MGTPPFSALFTKGPTFCDLLFTEALSGMGSALKLPSAGANSFHYELTPNKKVGKNEKCRVGSLENIPIYHKEKRT